MTWLDGDAFANLTPAQRFSAFLVVLLALFLIIRAQQRAIDRDHRRITP